MEVNQDSSDNSILEVIKYIEENINFISKGIPMSIEKLSTEQFEVFKHCAAHCIINGPVGVGKEDSFPSLFKGSLRSFFGVGTSQWRETCRMIAEKIEDQSIKQQSQYYRLHGDFWPLNVK